MTSCLFHKFITKCRHFTICHKTIEQYPLLTINKQTIWIMKTNIVISLICEILLLVHSPNKPIGHDYSWQTISIYVIESCSVLGPTLFCSTALEFHMDRFNKMFAKQLLNIQIYAQPYAWLGIEQFKYNFQIVLPK